MWKSQFTRDGRPYLVEVPIARYGGGAESTWHESFNLAARLNLAHLVFCPRKYVV